VPVLEQKHRVVESLVPDGSREAAADFGLSVYEPGYTSCVDPLEERISARQRSASAVAKARLAKLPLAVSLLRGLGAERVWLFGSLTTGATHEGSDVDLMVRGLPSSERTNAWLKLEELFEAPVDLVPEELASSAFRGAVHRRGQEITTLGGHPVAQ
jgi:predicted nucleotidyltransferase